MRVLLKKIKRLIASLLRAAIVKSPLSLNVQAWAIKRLLPLDPWPKSLVYQQCMANRILSSAGGVVQSGPFKGMTCLQDAEEGCLVPKLLGCYEEELSEVAEEFIQRGCDRIIDVGCASGYWLTGLTLRIPEATAIGFDLNEAARQRCQEMVKMNHVESRVQLLGGCTTAQLEQLSSAKTIIFMDCDGPEYELLDPSVAPKLLLNDIIVECHDYLNPLIIPTLIKRFEQTHSIERIPSRMREPSLARYPGLQSLPPAHWGEALAERRPCVQEWLVMRTR